MSIMSRTERARRAVEVRPAVKQAVMETSLRQVAEEIEVSHGTLGNLVNDVDVPSERTLMLVDRWLGRRGQGASVSGEANGGSAELIENLFRGHDEAMEIVATYADLLRQSADTTAKFAAAALTVLRPIIGEEPVSPELTRQLVQQAVELLEIVRSSQEKQAESGRESLERWKEMVTNREKRGRAALEVEKAPRSQPKDKAVNE